MKKSNQSHRIAIITGCLLPFAGVFQTATAASVALQQPTATFSQSFSGNLVASAIDGVVDDLGWAIAPDPFSNLIPAQTAVFETAAEVGFASGSIITFALTQAHSNPGHSLGRFRLSATTDDRNLFADGLANGGDVTANWVVLDPTAFQSSSGAILSELVDHSILASGPIPSTDVYTVSASTLMTGITGIRLEALEDPSLPFNGPGRYGPTGNFVLTEFQMDIVAVPEPSAYAIAAFGGLVLAALRRAKRS